MGKSISEVLTALTLCGANYRADSCKACPLNDSCKPGDNAALVDAATEAITDLVAFNALCLQEKAGLLQVLKHARVRERRLGIRLGGQEPLPLPRPAAYFGSGVPAPTAKLVLSGRQGLRNIGGGGSWIIKVMSLPGSGTTMIFPRCNPDATTVATASSCFLPLKAEPWTWS